MANKTADIVDVIDFNYEIMLNESTTSDPKNVKVQGLLQRANAKNQNGRIYPKPILERELDNFQKKIDARNAMGELDHPDSSTINLKNVSHIITKTWWEGNDVMGEIKTLNTPNGRILKNLILDNVNIGISSRGMGSVHEQMDGTLKVGDDLDLITWDVVSNPSTHGAYMDKRVNENKVLSESTRYSNRHNRISRTEETSRFLSEIISEMSDSYRF